MTKLFLLFFLCIFHSVYSKIRSLFPVSFFLFSFFLTSFSFTHFQSSVSNRHIEFDIIYHPYSIGFLFWLLVFDHAVFYTVSTPPFTLLSFFLFSRCVMDSLSLHSVFDICPSHLFSSAISASTLTYYSLIKLFKKRGGGAETLIFHAYPDFIFFIFESIFFFLFIFFVYSYSFSASERCKVKIPWE